MNQILSHTKQIFPLLTLAMLGLALPAQAGVMAVSATAPTIDGADIAMLNTLGSYDTGGDDGHIWADRPLMGQTFTTLSNIGGYSMSSITLQNFNNTVANNNATWTIRVGTVSGTTFTPLVTETSNNTFSYVSLDYFTFTFSAPVTLAPNTVYGFDWTTTGSGFVTANNADSNYTGGTNFRHGDDHVPNDTALIFPGDDRVFHLNLVAVPEPSATLWMASATLLGVVLRRRSKLRV